MNLGRLDMKRLQQLFRRHPPRLGFAVEGRAINIVRLEKYEGERLSVVSYGELDVDWKRAGVMEQQRIRSALKQLGRGVVRASVNLEHPSLRIRRMTFAKMPERDLLEAIRWSFREVVDGSLENYVVGYTPLPGEVEPNRVSLVAYGAAEQAITEAQAMIKALGLRLISIEPQATALLAAFDANGLLQDGQHHICVCFGDSFTQFNVMKGGTMLFSRPLVGINHDGLVQLVMRNMSMEERPAEDLLAAWAEQSGRGDAGGSPSPTWPPTSPGQPVAPDQTAAASPDVGLPAAAPPPEGAGPDPSALSQVGASVGHFFSQLSIEVQRSVDAFCIMYSVERVEDIWVCGKMIRYPGVVAHMQKTLGISTKVFNPFSRLMEPERQTPEVILRAPAFAVATGLAIP